MIRRACETRSDRYFTTPGNTQCVGAFNAALPAVLSEMQRGGMAKLLYTPMHELTGLCTTTAPLTNLCCGPCLASRKPAVKASVLC